MSLMINGMVDFGDGDRLSGFVGGGAGIAHINYRNQAVFATSAPFLDGEDVRFAWQLFAGARLPVSETIDITARYRFFNTSSHVVAFNGNEADSRFSSHSFLAGITLNFGGPGPQ